LYSLNQNAWSRMVRRRLATSTSLQLRRGSLPSSEYTWPPALPKCSRHSPIGPSHRWKRNWMNSTALGGPSSRVVRGRLASKIRSPSDCAPSAAIHSGRATARRYVLGAPPATASRHKERCLPCVRSRLLPGDSASGTPSGLRRRWRETALSAVIPLIGVGIQEADGHMSDLNELRGRYCALIARETGI
jgi:hypothetical protein